MYGDVFGNRAPESPLPGIDTGLAERVETPSYLWQPALDISRRAPKYGMLLFMASNAGLHAALGLAVLPTVNTTAIALSADVDRQPHLKHLSAKLTLL